MNRLLCPTEKACSACSLSNLSFEEQLRLKEKQCRRALSSFCKVQPITASPSFVRYRNKAQFVFKKTGKKIRYGIFKSATRSPALCEDCLLCSKRANEIAGHLCRLFLSFKITPYDFHQGTGYLKSVVIREGFATGEVMVILIGSDAIFPAKRTFVSALLKACPYITTIVLNHSKSADRLFIGETKEVLYREGAITDILCDRKFLISPKSFYQINSAQTGRLYQKAIELADLTGKEVVLDAYAGVGTIGICASKDARLVYSVEQNPQAVRDARKNAAINGIENITFICADSKDYVRKLKEEKKSIDVAFIDPPRAGCSLSFLNSLTKLSLDRIIYISCCIDTQKRDIAVLERKGYKAEVCYPFDMFPNTAHVESVVLMSRR